jgi:hypothetical protein
MKAMSSLSVRLAPKGVCIRGVCRTVYGFGSRDNTERIITMEKIEPKTVIKHTRTITTYYMSDEFSEEQLKGNLEGFLEELQLPDSYFAVGVMAVNAGDDEVDEVQTFTQLEHRKACLHVKKVGDELVVPPDFRYSLENELESWNIPYDFTMEAWEEHKLSRQWVDRVNKR